MAPTERFKKRTHEAKKVTRALSIEQVAEKFKRREKFILVDVREDYEWREGRIRGAIHLGKGVIERDIEELIPDVNTEIVLYCGGGSRASLAAESIQRMGYRCVFYMDGGYRGWIDAGLPGE
jgi:rhodanese-related sulfurtransferase